MLDIQLHQYLYCQEIQWNKCLNFIIHDMVEFSKILIIHSPGLINYLKYS